MRVLLIKMSSLGDVVHALVGVTDATQARPGIIFDWVVEEAYQEIPKWHPSVRRTILAPLRRWRKAPVKTVWSGELKGMRDELRRERYDVILDAQGLLKSAVVGQQARGVLVGRSARSAREPAAALLYKRRVGINLDLPEVEQLRQLFALALGYEQPDTPAHFGIDPSHFPPAQLASGPYAVFLHGAAWESKLWPEDRWIELGKITRQKGLRVLLPWGSETEKARAERVAASIKGDVLGELQVAQFAPILSGARFVVGLDTGLTHMAICLGTPTVTLYGPSVPVYGKVAGGKLLHLSSCESKTVDTERPNTVPLAQVIEAIAPWM